MQFTGIDNDGILSLSSWRAWIEMDRMCNGQGHAGSLSSWRAWIEIQVVDLMLDAIDVALLMESVD